MCICVRAMASMLLCSCSCECVHVTEWGSPFSAFWPGVVRADQQGVGGPYCMRSAALH